jgi:hypothetical protein
MNTTIRLYGEVDDTRWGHGLISSDMFVREVYRELAAP